MGSNTNAAAASGGIDRSPLAFLGNVFETAYGRLAFVFFFTVMADVASDGAFSEMWRLFPESFHWSFLAIPRLGGYAFADVSLIFVLKATLLCHLFYFWGQHLRIGDRLFVASFCAGIFGGGIAHVAFGSPGISLSGAFNGYMAAFIAAAIATPWIGISLGGIRIPWVLVFFVVWFAPKAWGILTGDPIADQFSDLHSFLLAPSNIGASAGGVVAGFYFAIERVRAIYGPIFSRSQIRSMRKVFRG